MGKVPKCLGVICLYSIKHFRISIRNGMQKYNNHSRTESSYPILNSEAKIHFVVRNAKYCQSSRYFWNMIIGNSRQCSKNNRIFELLRICTRGTHCCGKKYWMENVTFFDRTLTTRKNEFRWCMAKWPRPSISVLKAAHKTCSDICWCKDVGCFL